VRAFSSSATARQLVKPPVQVFGMEGRYATALYSAASKEKKLDIVEKELVTFQVSKINFCSAKKLLIILLLQQTMKVDAKLKEFIIDPSMQRKTKKAILVKLSAALKLSSVSTNLLG